MPRILVPQAAIAGIDLDGRRYHAHKGSMTVDDVGHAKRMVRDLECFTPSNIPQTARGFVCEDCGFHALIRTCSRCGGTCHRPGEHDAQS